MSLSHLPLLHLSLSLSLSLSLIDAPLLFPRQAWKKVFPAFLYPRKGRPRNCDVVVIVVIVVVVVVVIVVTSNIVEVLPGSLPLPRNWRRRYRRRRHRRHRSLFHSWITVERKSERLKTLEKGERMEEE